MLLKFSVENFMSIGEKQTIDFTITKKDKLNDSSTEICEKYVNNITCLLGANGSGKSNILKALSFLIEFAELSYKAIGINEKIRIIKHKLLKNNDSNFEICFINNNKIYHYVLELNQDEVLFEYLGVHVEKGFTRIFEINRSKDSFFFNEEIKINENDLSRLKNRKNISTFSFLIDMGYLLKFNIKNIFSGMYNNIGYQDSNIFLNNILNTSITFSDILIKNKNLRNNVLSKIKLMSFDIDSFEIKKTLNDVDMLYCKHINRDGKELILSFLEESLGTQNSITLLANILIILDKGGIAVIDEIENGIHPFIVEQIVSLFSNKEINKNNAQIIFSTHQPYLIKELTKTQIFFTEKDDLETEIYRLDDVEGVRNDDNFYTKYLNGVYGGVPEVK